MGENMEAGELVWEAEVMSGLLAWVTEEMAPPSCVTANGGGGGRPRGLGSKVNAFDLDWRCVILMETFNRQMELWREIRGGVILQTTLKPETSIPRITIV